VKRKSTRRTAIAGVVAALALAGAVPVSAATSGSTTATINTAVRSVTVSPSTTTFDSCATQTGPVSGSTLPFPNGNCFTNNVPVDVTNGPVPAHIDVQGGNAVPSDGGTPWMLCDSYTGTTAPCTGTGGLPGRDQFEEYPVGASIGSDLTNSPRCDAAFSAVSSCAAAAGQFTFERLYVTGPSASSDNSGSFITVWTWTAVP
jgi:hypothetical protein